MISLVGPSQPGVRVITSAQGPLPPEARQAAVDREPQKQSRLLVVAHDDVAPTLLQSRFAWQSPEVKSFLQASSCAAQLTVVQAVAGLPLLLPLPASGRLGDSSKQLTSAVARWTHPARVASMESEIQPSVVQRNIAWAPLPLMLPPSALNAKVGVAPAVFS